MTIERLQKLAVRLKEYNELKRCIDSLTKENDFKEFVAISEIYKCNIADENKKQIDAAVDKFKKEVAKNYRAALKEYEDEINNIEIAFDNKKSAEVRNALERMISTLEDSHYAVYGNKYRAQLMNKFVPWIVWLTSSLIFFAIFYKIYFLLLPVPPFILLIIALKVLDDYKFDRTVTIGILKECGNEYATLLASLEQKK